MQDETKDGLPTRNPSSLKTTSCRVHPANKELLKVNDLKTRPPLSVQPGDVSKNDATTIRVRPKGKIERIDCETNARVALFNSQKCGAMADLNDMAALFGHDLKPWHEST
nr:hypothetical protein [Tanacetum cinerariifolium]